MRYLDSGAVISDCGVYRYLLWRRWDLSRPNLGLVMLNPSTADAEKDDHTIRKCVGFAKRWDFGGIMVGNLYGYRAAKPKDMKAADDPVGPENDIYLRVLVHRCALIVVAWGVNCRWKGRSNRDEEVLRLLRKEDTPATRQGIKCLGSPTKDGFPKHPLLLPYTTPYTTYAGAPCR